MLGCSMVIGFIIVFILAFKIAGIVEMGVFWFFIVIIFGVNIVFAVHMLWGLIIEMADNIATIVDGGVETSNDEVKIPRPISERMAQPSAQPKNSVKPFVVNIEYDDETWECGNCRQLNDPDCEFCTNCGRAKGKSKINPNK